MRRMKFKRSEREGAVDGVDQVDGVDRVDELLDDQV